MIAHETFQTIVFVIILLINNITTQEPLSDQQISNKQQDDLTNIIIDETISIIREGNRLVHMPRRDHITLFMGDIDSGKATLVNFIRNDSFYTLAAEEVTVKNVTEVKIIDVNNPSLSEQSDAIRTRNFYPILFSDSTLAAEYYVCPSFFQNTNVTLHISSTFFLNKILQHAKMVKFIFVAKADNIIHNAKLFVHIGKLFKNIEKYKNSFALILTDSNAETRSYAQNTLKLLKKDSVSENTNTLIDILLNETASVDKIGLLHIPPENGLLSKMKAMTDDRAELLNLIDSIDYGEIERNDFDFKIEENQEHEIIEILKAVTQKISKIVLTIGEQIYEGLQSEEKRINNLNEAKNYFLRSQDAFTIVTNNSVEVFKNTTKLIESLKYLFKQINLTYSDEIVLHYMKYNNFLTILQMVTEQELLDQFTIETEPLQDTFKRISEFIDDSLNVYSFFINLYIKLGDWTTQNDTTKFSLNTLKDIIKTLQKSQASSITGKNLEVFFNQLYRKELINVVEIPYLTEIKTAEFNAIKLSYLFKILDLTLTKKVQLKCIERNKISAVGDYVKLSDVIRNVVCPNVNLTEIELIDIKALNVIFIDTDLIIYSNVSHGLQIAMVAPTWQIIDKHEIILVGGYFADYKLPNAMDGSNGTNGFDGSPGKPGYPGGSFFGIGNVFINGENFKIKSIGGNGSIGQNGGKGGAGANGTDASKRGVFGGAGGNGGRGGLGGLAGSIRIFELGESSKITIEQTNGTNGPNGTGGMGGQGGTNFKGCTPNCQVINGVNGIDGGNINNIGQPIFNYFQHPAQIVNNFKAFILDNLNDPIKNSFLGPTYNALHSHKTSNLYDTLGLVTELDNLEQRYYQLYGKLNFLPFYENLLDRVHRYLVFPKEHEREMEYRKVLIFIYSAVYSKICSLRNDNGDSLIVDIHEYLAYVIGNIRRFEKTRNTLIQNEINQNYKERIDGKIVEGQIFLEKSVIPAIEKIYNDVEKNFYAFINEIVALEQKAKRDLKHLLYLRREAEKLMVVNLFFNTIKTVSSAVGLFGSGAGPISSLMDKTVSMAHSTSVSFIEDDFSYSESKLPDGVHNTLNGVGGFINEMDNEKLPVLNYVVDLAIKANASECEFLTNRLVEIYNSPDMTTNQKFDNFRQLINQCVNADGRTKIKKRAAETNTEGDWKEDSLKLLGIAELSMEWFENVKTDINRVQQMQNFIAAKEQEIKEIQEFKATVYNTIMPLVKKMFGDLSVSLSHLKLYSRIALDVAEWKIKSRLSSVKSSINQFSKGFAAQEKFDMKFTELFEAIDTVITIYGRIQTYNENKKLADYLYEMDSAGSKSIEISNPILETAVLRLDVLIKTNIILINYKDAMNGLKQYIFPFADYYLREFNLPKEIVINDTIKDFVQYTIEQIQTLELTLTKSDAIIYTKHDEHLIKEKFNSDKKSLQPFYVWPNSEYNSIIKKLLSGEEVVLYADITRAPMKNSVKFNRIELKFKSKIPEVQNTVNKLLEDFEIRLRHLGQSLYRCDNKFYVMSNSQQYIRYSFAKDFNDEPIQKNNVYDKLRRHFLLSPYALWTFQIVAPDQNLYLALQNYTEYLDLELGGYGQYVASSSSICKTDMEDYYVTDKNLKTDYTINLLGEEDEEDEKEEEKQEEESEEKKEEEEEQDEEEEEEDEEYFKYKINFETN